MTIKELYETAKNHNCENFEIAFAYFNEEEKEITRFGYEPYLMINIKDKYVILHDR